MTKHIIGIDLGTANTLIWLDKGETAVFNEPTVLSRNIETKKVQDIGYLASKMLGRSPYNIKITKPLKRGVVANLDDTVDFIKQAFANLKMSKVLKGSTIILATPSDITQVERNALTEVAKRLDAKEIIIESVSIFDPNNSNGVTSVIFSITLKSIPFSKSIEAIFKFAFCLSDLLLFITSFPFY